MLTNLQLVVRPFRAENGIVEVESRPKPPESRPREVCSSRWASATCETATLAYGLFVGGLLNVTYETPALPCGVRRPVRYRAAGGNPPPEGSFGEVSAKRSS